MATFTPSRIKNDIGIINKLREHEKTKDLYANVTGADYDDYLLWFKQWEQIAGNPVLMEENCIGGDRFELEFTFYPNDNVLKLIGLYLTETALWETVEFAKGPCDTLVLTIGA